jgi:hypothetical protein
MGCSFMKREFPPVYLALILILGCVVLRVLNNAYPDLVPNVSPLMAIAFVGAIYLPRRWGWLVGPVTLLLTDLAFVKSNALTGGSGSMFSSWTFVSFAFYAAAGGFGGWIATRKSLGKIIAGSLLCSLLFYVVSNTFSFWYDLRIGLTPGYPATWAGWWQANTVGLAQFEPTWHFLRNGMLGDLFFAMVLLLVLDRGLLFGQAPARTAPHAA